MRHSELRIKMTVIAALAEDGHVYMSGDSAVVNSNTLGLQRISDPKVIKKGDMLFGTCGSVRLAQIIRYLFKVPGDNLKTDGSDYVIKVLLPELKVCMEDNDYLNGDEESFGGGDAILIGYQGKLYTIYQDFAALCSSDGIEAIGIAADLAIGALAAQDTNKDAIQRLNIAMLACEKFNSMVRAPFFTESI